MLGSSQPTESGQATREGRDGGGGRDVGNVLVGGHGHTGPFIDPGRVGVTLRRCVSRPGWAADGSPGKARGARRFGRASRLSPPYFVYPHDGFSRAIVSSCPTRSSGERGRPVAGRARLPSYLAATFSRYRRDPTRPSAFASHAAHRRVTRSSITGARPSYRDRISRIRTSSMSTQLQVPHASFPSGFHTQPVP